MLNDRIETAERGAALWLGDMREQAANGKHRDLVFELRTLDGVTRCFSWPLPDWESDAERKLVREYLAAAVFNTLSCFGGERLCLCLPEENPELLSLLQELRELFQLEETERTGYGKVVQIADRLCRAAGKERFRLEWETRAPSEQHPIPEQRPAIELQTRLRTLTQAAASAFCCGIDVGGTDIKAAVSHRGRLLCVKEYDWDPAGFQTAEELIEPICLLARLLRLAPVCGEKELFQNALRRSAGITEIREAVEALEKSVDPSPLSFDGVGLSFPDVVMHDRILGGETPKTRGMRENPALVYETEFAKIGQLGERLGSLCRPGVRVRIANDGNVAAFSSALEMACQGTDIADGVFAHSLGTDLGTGWLPEEGVFLPFPLEMYDFLIDLGSHPQRAFAPEDVRSVRNENSGLPDARKYLGQSAAFRLAYERKPALLEGFLERTEDRIAVRTTPEDLRKPCLEHLMQQAESGDPDACAVFREIGRNLGQISREIDFLLHPGTKQRYLFGRFIKHPVCFRLLRQGCREIMPELELLPADDSLAFSPLMRQLAERRDVTVAQFGQAVGAIYFGLLQEEHKDETK